MLSGSFCYITCHSEIYEFRMAIFVDLSMTLWFRSWSQPQRGWGIPAPLGVPWKL